MSLNVILCHTKKFDKIKSEVIWNGIETKRGLNGSRFRLEDRNMLMKICNCGRRVRQGEKCTCKKNRHKIYDEMRRDKNKKNFYHSTKWKKIVKIIKERANGLDEYMLLSKGVIEIGSTVHHIYTMDERPDLKMSLDNLIFVSARTHNMIHAQYAKGGEEKQNLQKKLSEVATR